MSIVSQAKAELARLGCDDKTTAKMVKILELFFEEWDSGGAVHWAAPILQRLIAGKCLSPLTGADDEWFDHGHCKQNVRISSVFKDDARFPGIAYDLDNPAGPRVPITFPYFPERAEVASPLVEIEI